MRRQGSLRGRYKLPIGVLWLAVLIGLVPLVSPQDFPITFVAYAEDCPGDPPPPPPPSDCGGAPCPTLPSTGGGGCDINPDACPGGQNHPIESVNLPSKYATVSISTALDAFPQRLTATTSIFPVLVIVTEVNSLATGAIHPCLGDPPPPPPPPIPVCASCEAPGVADSIELPNVAVRMNPATGMVNVATWFWAENYRGQDLYASRSWSYPYEDTTIEVRYFVREYLWNYGDGGQISSRSLGQPYPQQSDIQNAYGWSSKTEPGGVFHGALGIRWGVEYRVNGGAPTALADVTRSYGFIHPVQQLQPVIGP